MKFGGEILTRQNFDKYHQKSAKFRNDAGQNSKKFNLCAEGTQTSKKFNLCT